jgi:hypothetical protein
MFSGLAQIIVNNAFLPDVDNYDQIDSLMPKFKFREKNIYKVILNGKALDSLLLYSQKYNDSGRLVELVKWNETNNDKIEYSIFYSKISDTIFQTITRYPLGSSMIDEGFTVDSIIDGKKNKINLYSPDKNGNIFVKSIYILHNNSRPEICRYDINDKLIHIFYPNGSRQPLYETTDTVHNKNGKIISTNTVYKENIYTNILTYNRKDYMLESYTSNVNLSTGSEVKQKKVFVYNDKGLPVVLTSMNENNELVYEERFSYKGKVLKLYTKDFDLDIEGFNEERRYDDLSNITFMEERSNFPERRFTWKYYYNELGLKIRYEYFYNQVLRYAVVDCYK